MLDKFLFSIAERPVARIAARLDRTGATPDLVTLVGFLLGLGAVPLLAGKLFLPALGLILLNRIFDALDGALARLNGASDRGAYIDIAFDFFFYGSVPLGFALADPAVNALPAAVLLVSFIGTGSSFLALAVLAQKQGLKNEGFPRKGIYYLGGIVEGTETVVCFVLMCLLPGRFPLFAYAFAGLCFMTAVLRWHWGWKILSPR